jgi:hypothetical protein
MGRERSFVVTLEADVGPSHPGADFAKVRDGWKAELVVMAVAGLEATLDPPLV